MDIANKLVLVCSWTLFVLFGVVFSAFVLCFRAIWELSSLGIWILKRFDAWHTGEFCPKCGKESFYWRPVNSLINEMRGTQRWIGTCYRYACKHEEMETRAL